MCLQASLDVADPVVSPKRAALVRKEVSEDGWGPAQLPDQFPSVRSSHTEHVVRMPKHYTACMMHATLVANECAVKLKYIFCLSKPYDKIHSSEWLSVTMLPAGQRYGVLSLVCVSV